jgi:hypothetical protein
VAFDSLPTNTNFVARARTTAEPVPVVNNAFDRLMASRKQGGAPQPPPPTEGEREGGKGPGYYRTAGNETRFRFANGVTVPATGVDRI